MADPGKGGSGIDGLGSGLKGSGKTNAPLTPQPARPEVIATMWHSTRNDLKVHLLFLGFNMNDLNDTKFLSRFNETLQWIEQWVEELINTHDFDIDTRRSGNVLELIFDNGSKMVINSQTPLHELWLASQLGGFHYRLDDTHCHWLDTRTHTGFIDVLHQHIQHHVGQIIAPPNMTK